jgi:hypothetical protein
MADRAHPKTGDLDEHYYKTRYEKEVWKEAPLRRAKEVCKYYLLDSRFLSSIFLNPCGSSQQAIYNKGLIMVVQALSPAPFILPPQSEPIGIFILSPILLPFAKGGREGFQTCEGTRPPGYRIIEKDPGRPKILAG